MPDELRLTDLTEQFVREIVQRYSAPTVAAYAQALHIFGQHVSQHHNIKLSSATSSDLSPGWGVTFMDWLQATRSVETEHLYMRAVYQFYQYVAQRSEVTPDWSVLAQHIDSYRRPKIHLIPSLPFAALRRIVEFAATANTLSGAASEREALGLLRDRAFLLTLAFTGLRISEICDLRKSQVNPELAHIAFQEGSQLPLPSEAIGSLKTYLTKRNFLDQQQPLQWRDDLPLFARHDKRVGSRILPISRWTGANIVDAWVRAALTPEERKQLDETNQSITPHTFRHHFVLNALMNSDHDLARTQTLARHEDRSTTRRYLHKLMHDPHSQP